MLDDHQRLAFLTLLVDRVNKPSSQDAFVYGTVALASVNLHLKNLEGARTELDRAEAILDGFDSVETVVHATFYRINADYYHVGGGMWYDSGICPLMLVRHNMSSLPTIATPFFSSPAST